MCRRRHLRWPEKAQIGSCIRQIERNEENRFRFLSLQLRSQVPLWRLKSRPVRCSALVSQSGRFLKLRLSRSATRPGTEPAESRIQRPLSLTYPRNAITATGEEAANVNVPSRLPVTASKNGGSFRNRAICDRAARSKEFGGLADVMVKVIRTR